MERHFQLSIFNFQFYTKMYYKRKHIFISIALAVSCLFLSCEEELEFSDKISTPKLVLNSLLTPGSTVRVHLSESGFLLVDPESFNLVSDADVYIYKDNERIEKLHYIGDGFYDTRDFTPSAGDVLKITASNSKYSEVTAETFVVDSVPVESVGYSNFREERYLYDSSQTLVDGKVVERIYTYQISEYFDLDVRFSDPAEEDNYYRLVLYGISYYNNYKVVETPTSFNINDVLAGTTGNWGGRWDVDNDDRYNEFTDGILNGKEISLKIPVPYSRYYQDVDGNGNIINEYTHDETQSAERIHFELRVDLQSISRDYYLYLKSRYASESSADFGGLFSEPVQVYNNINNGLGIFGSHSSSTVVIEVKKD